MKLLLFLLLTGWCAVVAGQVRLPDILADSMVLQRSMAVPLWGRASPGEKVSVKGSWPGAVREATTAGQDSQWMVKITTPAAGGPYDVVIHGDARHSGAAGDFRAAGDTIILHGVLIGEVWLCSGQSNMQMPLQGWDNAPLKDAKKEVAAANYPAIRLYTVRRRLSFTPQTEAGGELVALHARIGGIL